MIDVTELFGDSFLNLGGFIVEKLLLHFLKYNLNCFICLFYVSLYF